MLQYHHFIWLINTVQFPPALASDIEQSTSIPEEASYTLVNSWMLLDSVKSMIPRGMKIKPITINSKIKPLMLSFGLNATSFCCEKGLLTGLRDIIEYWWRTPMLKVADVVQLIRRILSAIRSIFVLELSAAFTFEAAVLDHDAAYKSSHTLKSS